INFLGSCNATDVLQGLDYVASVGAAGDVANLSLSFFNTQQALNNAIVALGTQGIYVAIAAGNNSNNASGYSPANANGINVYTVSAMDANDQFASFSSFGNPPVDFCAPGVDIYSTYTNNGYSTLSGTSMAAPHVAGLLLINNGALNSDGFVLGDPDGVADPIAHK
ncbi:MAG: S8 family serine peptidase, partial [Luteibaculum sp.]